ncbi:hypothetical protein P3S67_007880 [Capsicum chacoense]
MADQNREFDVNEDIDLNKEYDLIEKIDSLERKNHSLKTRVEELEATHRVELEAKEREIEHRKKMLEELDNRWKSQKDLQSMTKDELVESGVNELLRKIGMLEATRRIELEAKEGKISGLKRQREEQESRWKSQKDFSEWRSISWRKGLDNKGLQTKISENKLEIQDKVISQMRIKKNEIACGSSSVNIDQ